MTFPHPTPTFTTMKTFSNHLYNLLLHVSKSPFYPNAAHLPLSTHPPTPIIVPSHYSRDSLNPSISQLTFKLDKT